MDKALTKIVIGLVAFAASGMACAQTCWEQASARYGVNPHILVAIAKHESGLNPGAVRRNNDGTMDRGIMQINSIHLPELRRYGITERHLLDPCVNVHIGAWLLSRHIARFGNTWQAVGAYHSKTPSLNRAYALRIWRKLVAG